MHTINAVCYRSIRLMVDVENWERIVIEKEVEILIDSRTTVRLATNNHIRGE